MRTNVHTNRYGQTTLRGPVIQVPMTFEAKVSRAVAAYFGVNVKGRGVRNSIATQVENIVRDNAHCVRPDGGRGITIAEAVAIVDNRINA